MFNENQTPANNGELASILGDDATYPMDFAPNGEEIYDKEILPKLIEAHQLAAKHGLPIFTACAFAEGQVGNLSTVKNANNLPSPYLTALVLMAGEHMRCSRMLLQAVVASRDGLLIEKYVRMAAEAMDIDLTGLSRQEVASRVRDIIAQRAGPEDDTEELN